MPEFGHPFSGLAAGRKLTKSELVRAVRYLVAAEYEAVQMYIQLAESISAHPQATVRSDRASILGAFGLTDNIDIKLCHVAMSDDVLRLFPGPAGFLQGDNVRNLPVISDLLVNMAPFYERMEQVQFPPTRIAEPVLDETTGRPAVQPSPVLRYEDCMECGLCFSACPIFGTDPEYLGPEDEPSLALFETLVRAAG